MRIPCVVTITIILWLTDGWGAEVALLEPATPWRAFAVSTAKAKSPKSAPGTTALPPPAWTQAEFDDASWGQCSQGDLLVLLNATDKHAVAAQRLCLRTRFGIADPAPAKDVKLKLQVGGKAVVYVNGTMTSELSGEGTVDLPSTALRKGVNVLAMDLSDPTRIGLSALGLTSGSGAGVMAYASAARGAMVWNATPLDVIANIVGKPQQEFLIFGLSVTPSGLMRGNPFDPLRPLRLIAPRGGNCSGQIVISADAPFQGLQAQLTPLKHTGGTAVLPVTAVRLAYAMQQPADKFCNALLPSPVAGAAVQPVWVLVDVPRDQPPGWYTGALTVNGAGRTATVAVEVFVAGWTLTDPRNNATFVSVYQSPDTLADHYQVPPWSDRHFALIERSLGETAGLGTDLLYYGIP